MEQTLIAIAVEPAPIRHPKLSDITAMPKPRYKGHWALIASDVKTTEAFYQALTGSELICRPQPVSACVSWDEEHHRFFLADRLGLLTMMGKASLAAMPAPPRAGERTGEAGGGIRYGSPHALVKVFERMQAAGHQPIRIVDKGALVSLLYRDPDGLLVDAFAAVAGAAAKAEESLDASAFKSRFG